MAPPTKPLTGPDDPRHGTRQGYRKGCRLDCCRGLNPGPRDRAREAKQAVATLNPDQTEDAWFLIDTGETHPETIASRIGSSAAVVTEWMEQAEAAPRPRQYYLNGTVRRFSADD